MHPISDGRFGKELAVYLRVLDIALSQLGLEFSDNYNCPEVAILRGLRSDRQNCSLANRTPIIRNPGRNGYVSGTPQQPETCYETRGLRKYESPGAHYCPEMLILLGFRSDRSFVKESTVRASMLDVAFSQIGPKSSEALYCPGVAVLLDFSQQPLTFGPVAGFST